MGCKNVKQRKRWRNGTILKNLSHINPLLPMDKFFCQSLKHLNKGQEGFRDKSEAWKAAFSVRSITEF